MGSKQSCTSQLCSPKACGAVPNRGEAFQSVRAMLNSYSLSLARSLCQFPVMPSEPFLPSPKVLNTHCWSASCPVPHGDVQADLLGRHRKWGQQRDPICFPSLKLVMVYFTCTLKVIFWAPAIMEQDETVLQALQTALLCFSCQQGPWEIFLSFSINSTRLRCNFVPRSFQELRHCMGLVFHTSNICHLQLKLHTNYLREPKSMLVGTNFSCNEIMYYTALWHQHCHLH